MECKNPHCKRRNFIPIINFKRGIIIGLECESCGAIYTEDEIEVKKSVNRINRWNSAIWETGFRK